MTFCILYFALFACFIAINGLIHISQQKVLPFSRLFSLKDSNFIKEKLDESANIILNAAKAHPKVKIAPRPGYALSLACHNWFAAGYQGKMMCYEAKDLIHWMTTSYLEPIPEDDINGPNTLLLTPNDTVKYFDLLILAHPNTSHPIPHCRLSVKQSMQGNYGYQIIADYPSRIDCLSSLEYYDQYYKEIDYYNACDATALADGSSSSAERIQDYILQAKVAHVPESPLTRLIASPMYVNFHLPDEKVELVSLFIQQHLQRWCQWLIASSEHAPNKQKQIDTPSPAPSSPTSSQQYNLQRDINLQTLIYEETKYQVAEILGPKFSPKSLDIAAVLVGPRILSQ